MYRFTSAIYSIYVRAGGHYLLFAIIINAIYGAMAIKSGCVIAYKVVMIVRVAGLRGNRC